MVQGEARESRERMTKKLPAFQFYTGDWMKDPQVSMCAPATRGIWIDLLCAMHDSGQSGEVTGTVEQLARLCRCTPSEMEAALEDLSVTNCANVTLCNNGVTVECRRMKKEAKSRQSSKLRVARHREKQVGNGGVTPPSSSSSSISSSVTSLINADTPVLGEESATPPTAKKGTRIPTDFGITSEMLDWANERHIDIDLDRETEKFVNYWLAAPGQKGVKRDWPATWRNWILRAWENYGQTKQIGIGTARATNREKLSEYDALFAKYEDNG